MTGRQQIELGLHSISLNLQLSAALRAFLFRTSAANPRQAMLDVLRLQVLFQLLQTRLEFSLFCFYFAQLRAQASGFLLRTILNQNKGRSRGRNKRKLTHQQCSEDSKHS